MKTNEKRHCIQCGAEQAEDARFCPYCGMRVVKDENLICPKCGSVTKRGMLCMQCGYMTTFVCPACGKDVFGNEKFCPECGKEMQDTELMNPHSVDTTTA